MRSSKSWKRNPVRVNDQSVEPEAEFKAPSPDLIKRSKGI